MEYAKEAVLTVAKLMVASAITSPKAKGINNIVVKIVESRDDIEKIASKMEELAPKYGRFYARDADNVRNSDALVLIGCKFVSFNLKQPEKWKMNVNDVMSLTNLGIAIGSAVKTASLHNIDNRVMFSLGVAAQELGIVDADIVLGIPLSVKGKNIYFDRLRPK